MALGDALFTITDVRGYREVDANFSTVRFASYLKEVQEVHLKNLLGQALWYDLFIHITDTKYTELLGGKVYTYNLESIYYPGLKPWLVWNWLLKNIHEGNINHTNRGTLQFNPETAIQSEKYQIQQTIGAYQLNIKTEENNIKRFLNENYTNYPLWDIESEDKTTGLSIQVL